MKVVVVGGGIMGLASAWGCARRGHAVELLERGPLPNPLASSHDESRLIRYPYGTKTNYARMVRDAFVANDRLFSDLGTSFFVETGTLVVVRKADPAAEATRHALEALNVAFDIMTAEEIAVRYPLLATADLDWGMILPSGGVLLARRLLQALVVWLAHHDRVRLRPHTAAVGLDLGAARAVTEGGETVAGDRLIVTAGPWTGTLLPDVADRVTPSRQIALDLTTDSERAALWRSMPMLLDGISWRGTGLYAVPPVADLPLKVGDHSFTLRGHPDHDRTATPEDVHRLVDLLPATLRDPAAYAPADARTCFYSVTADECFIANGKGPSLILAGFSGHGFKFGPLIGTAAAAWCDGDIEAATLGAWLAGNTAERPAAFTDDEHVTSPRDVG